MAAHSARFGDHARDIGRRATAEAMPGRSPVGVLDLVPRRVVVSSSTPAPAPPCPIDELWLSPALPPWGCDIITAEGRTLLRGATGAAAAVLTAANAVSTASGISVAAEAQANICSYTIPARMVGILRGYYARPWSTLGYDSGHVTFAVLVGGRKMRIPSPVGLRGSFKDLIPIHDVAKPGWEVAVQGTNGSTATWHRVDAVLEIVLVPIERYRRRVDPNF